MKPIGSLYFVPEQSTTEEKKQFEGVPVIFFTIFDHDRFSAEIIHVIVVIIYKSMNMKQQIYIQLLAQLARNADFTKVYQHGIDDLD